MKIDGDYLVLSDGTRVYAYQGVVGIDADFNLYYGFDGDLQEFETKMTAQQRAELADYMIDLWRTLKDKAP